MPRLITPDDMPWLHELCAKAYPAGYYDPDAADAWVRRLIVSPNYMAMRGERAAMICGNCPFPYAPKVKVADFLLIASFGRAWLELVAMTETCIKWAREIGVKRVIWSSMTGVDFRVLAEHFGARPISPDYSLEI